MESLKVGDVVTSPAFIYGERIHRGEVVSIQRIPGPHFMESRVSEEDRLAEAAKTGKIPPKYLITDLSADDESRARAKFVVEAVKSTGGGQGQGCGDYYSPEDYVQARRLDRDGKYDPAGEVIEFFPSRTKCEIVGSLSLHFS